MGNRLWSRGGERKTGSDAAPSHGGGPGMETGAPPGAPPMPGDGGPQKHRRGLNAPLVALAILLMAAGALAIFVGLYGELEECAGGCAQQENAQTEREPITWLIGAGVGLAALGLLGIVALVIRARSFVTSAAIQPDATGELPVRVCPHCSTSSRTAGEFCPYCGTRFVRSGMSRTAKAILVSGAVVLFFAGAGAGAFAYVSMVDDEVEERRELAAEHRAEQEREAAAAAAEQEQQFEVDLRRDLITEIEDSITEDMQARSEESYAIVEGPILGTQCDPAPGQDLTDTSVNSMELECLAYNEMVGDQIEGYNVSASVNFNSGRYSWQLGN
jgi:hypothetical protein